MWQEFPGKQGISVCYKKNALEQAVERSCCGKGKEGGGCFVCLSLLLSPSLAKLSTCDDILCLGCVVRTDCFFSSVP